MLDNNLYNLMEQLTVESKSCQRIRDLYLKDAGNDETSRRFWETMVKDKEGHINDLRELIKQNI